MQFVEGCGEHVEGVLKKQAQEKYPLSRYRLAYEF